MENENGMFGSLFWAKFVVFLGLCLGSIYYSVSFSNEAEREFAQVHMDLEPVVSECKDGIRLSHEKANKHVARIDALNDDLISNWYRPLQSRVSTDLIHVNGRLKNVLELCRERSEVSYDFGENLSENETLQVQEMLEKILLSQANERLTAAVVSYENEKHQLSLRWPDRLPDFQ